MQPRVIVADRNSGKYQPYYPRQPERHRQMAEQQYPQTTRQHVHWQIPPNPPLKDVQYGIPKHAASDVNLLQQPPPGYF